MKKVIEGFSKYTISVLGEIENIKTGKQVKPAEGTNGYLQVFLVSDDGRQKTKKVHKLVANTFLDKIDSTQKYVVDHINGDKKDNKLLNLRVVTNRENTTRNVGKYKTGVSFYTNRNKPFRAEYKIKNKSFHIGYFLTEEEAHDAYLKTIAGLI